MLFAFLLLASSVADWVPMRWGSPDPKSLDLLSGTAINCILVERPHWSGALVKEARSRNIAVLGVVRPGTSAEEAVPLGFDGIVLEGDFEKRPQLDKLVVIDLPSRARMRFD